MTTAADDHGRWTRTPAGEDPRAADRARQDAESVAAAEEKRVVEHDETGVEGGSVGAGEDRTGDMGVSSERGGRQAGYPHDA